MSEIDTVSMQIACELKDHMPVWFGHEAHFIETAPTVYSKRNSLILRYAFRDTKRIHHIYVKLARRPRLKTLADAIASQDMRKRAQDEFRLLTDIDAAAQRYAPAELCALRPLGYFPRWNAVVTEELSSKSLKSLMFAPTTLLHMPHSQQQVERACSLAGSWLHMFHTRVGDCRLEAFDDTEIIQDTDRIFTNLMQFTHYDLRRQQDVFQSRISAQRGRQVPIALVHGDYGAFNVIVAPDGRVGSLDVSEIRRGSIYFDIGWFLSDLRVNGLQALSWGKIMTKKTIKTYQQAFLSGYFKGQEIDQEMLTLMSLYYVIFKWLQHEEKLQRRTKTTLHIVRPWIERYFHHVVLTLTAHLESK